MAVQGQINTYDETTTTQRTIEALIKIIDPQDVPCVKHFGLNNQGKFKFQAWPNHKYEWLEDTLPSGTDQLNEALDDSETGVDVDDGTKFKPGDVILVEDEKMWVSAVSSNTLTVERGWGDSTAASHDDDTTVQKIFSARLEGDDSDASYYTTPSSPFNYSQIMHYEIRVSNSELRASTRYGITDTEKYQLKKAIGGLGSGNGKMGRAGFLMIEMERTFFYGEKVQRAAGTAGAMGGVDTFVTTNVDNAGGVRLDQDRLEDQIQACWDGGGMPGLIICNAFNKRLISSWYQPSVRTQRTEGTGGSVINRIETEFGTLGLMLNRWCPSNKVYILQDDLMGWTTLRNWENHVLSVGGDYTKKEVVGEFGFVLQNEEAHAIIDNLATS